MGDNAILILDGRAFQTAVHNPLGGHEINLLDQEHHQKRIENRRITECNTVGVTL